MKTRTTGELFAEILLHGHSFETERDKLAILMKDMSQEEIIEYVLNYNDWARRCFSGVHVENSSIAKRGDLIKEIKSGKWLAGGEKSTPKDYGPMVYIGSVRLPKAEASTRLVIRLSDKRLVKAYRIEKL